MQIVHVPSVSEHSFNRYRKQNTPCTRENHVNRKPSANSTALHKEQYEYHNLPEQGNGRNFTLFLLLKALYSGTCDKRDSKYKCFFICSYQNVFVNHNYVVSKDPDIYLQFFFKEYETTRHLVHFYHHLYLVFCRRLFLDHIIDSRSSLEEEMKGQVIFEHIQTFYKTQRHS